MKTGTSGLFSFKIRSKKDLLSRLYENYGHKMCAYAVHTWKVNEDEAWDLTYKTLYRIIDVYDRYSFENDEKLRAFIFTTFINYIKNHFRDNKHRQAFHTEWNDQLQHEAQNEELTEMESPEMQALREVLEELEDWQRILVLMRSDGRSYSEIAAFIDKPENQLKVYYQRIKERISRKIHGDE